MASNPDVQIGNLGTGSAPLAYTVAGSQEFRLLAANATFDGAAAGGSWLPTLELISDSGQIIARSPVATSVAAGGAAEVSWFRGLRKYLFNQIAPVTGNIHIHQCQEALQDGGLLFFTGRNAFYVADPQAADGFADEWSAPLFADYSTVYNQTYIGGTYDFYEWSWPDADPPIPSFPQTIQMRITAKARLTDPLTTGRLTLLPRTNASPIDSYWTATGGTAEPPPSGFTYDDIGGIPNTQTWTGSTTYQSFVWIVKYTYVPALSGSPVFDLFPWYSSGSGDILLDELILEWPV